MRLMNVISGGRGWLAVFLSLKGDLVPGVIFAVSARVELQPVFRYFCLTEEPAGTSSSSFMVLLCGQLTLLNVVALFWLSLLLCPRFVYFLWFFPGGAY